MRSALWLRLIRGLFATLFVLTTGGVAHHHADHDGNLVHMDEAHGTHGTARAPDAFRPPGVVPVEIQAAEILQPGSPDLAPPPLRVTPTTLGSITPFGHDPPGALGSRAPPLPSL